MKQPAAVSLSMVWARTTTAEFLRKSCFVLAVAAMLPSSAEISSYKELKTIRDSVSDKLTASFNVDATQLNGRFIEDENENKCSKVWDAQLLDQPAVKKVSLMSPVEAGDLLTATHFLFSGKIRSTFGLHDDKLCTSANPTVLKGYTVDVQNFLVMIRGEPRIESVTNGIEWKLYRDMKNVPLDLIKTLPNKRTVTVYDSENVEVSDRQRSAKLRKIALMSIFEAVKKAVGDVYSDVMRTQQWIVGEISPKAELDARKIAKLTKSAFDPSTMTFLGKTIINLYPTWMYSHERIWCYKPTFESPSFNDVAGCKDDGSNAQWEKVTASAAEQSKDPIQTEFRVKKVKFSCKSKTGDNKSIKFPEISVTVNAQHDTSAQGTNRFPFSCSVFKKSLLDANDNTNVGLSKEAIGKVFDDLTQKVEKYACDFALEMIAVSLSNFPNIRGEAFYMTRIPKATN